MRAGHAGHIFGTRNSYIMIGPATGGSVVGANKVHLDFFNATGSGVTIEVHGIWVMNDFDVAVTGIVAVRIDLIRTSTVGTGGTALGFEATTATRTISRVDPGFATLPAQITAREAPGGGATSSVFLGQWYTMPEEAATSQGYLTQFANGIRYAQLEDMSDLVIPENTGIKLVQGPVASVGRVGYRIAFTTV